MQRHGKPSTNTWRLKYCLLRTTPHAYVGLFWSFIGSVGTHHLSRVLLAAPCLQRFLAIIYFIIPRGGGGRAKANQTALVCVVWPERSRHQLARGGRPTVYRNSPMPSVSAHGRESWEEQLKKKNKPPPKKPRRLLQIEILKREPPPNNISRKPRGDQSWKIISACRSMAALNEMTFTLTNNFLLSYANGKKNEMIASCLCTAAGAKWNGTKQLRQSVALVSGWCGIASPPKKKIFLVPLSVSIKAVQHLPKNWLSPHRTTVMINVTFVSE